jgi:CheY-like chemotaxis protein
MPLTAYANSEDARQALKAGFQTRVAKPVEPIELATAPSLAGWVGSEEGHEEGAKAMKRGND